MTKDDDLAAFIRQNLTSVWRLELLLLLMATRERAWSVEALVKELRASTPLVTANLTALSRSGLVLEEAETYRYCPASTILDDICRKIAVAYRERPVAVINLIAAPDDKLQSLADAFRFRQGPK